MSNLPDSHRQIVLCEIAERLSLYDDDDWALIATAVRQANDNLQAKARSYLENEVTHACCDVCANLYPNAQTSVIYGETICDRCVENGGHSHILDPAV